jgi:hypothetical protein
VGPLAGLNTEDRGKILCLCRGSNPDRPARSETFFYVDYVNNIDLYLNSNIHSHIIKGTHTMKKDNLAATLRANFTSILPVRKITQWL